MFCKRFCLFSQVRGSYLALRVRVHAVLSGQIFPSTVTKKQVVLCFTVKSEMFGLMVCFMVLPLFRCCFLENKLMDVYSFACVFSKFLYLQVGLGIIYYLTYITVHLPLKVTGYLCTASKLDIKIIGP